VDSCLRGGEGPTEVLPGRIRRSIRRPIRRWLVSGKVWLDGGRKRTAVSVAPETMQEEALRDPTFAGLGESEQEGVALLLVCFRGPAEQGNRLSALRRWWLGAGRKGRLGVYVRRAL
jgi:hypothetical protein